MSCVFRKLPTSKTRLFCLASAPRPTRCSTLPNKRPMPTSNFSRESSSTWRESRACRRTRSFSSARRFRIRCSSAARTVSHRLQAGSGKNRLCDVTFVAYLHCYKPFITLSLQVQCATRYVLFQLVCSIDRNLLRRSYFPGRDAKKCGCHTKSFFSLVLKKSCDEKKGYPSKHCSFLWSNFTASSQLRFLCLFVCESRFHTKAKMMIDTWQAEKKTIKFSALEVGQM